MNDKQFLRQQLKRNLAKLSKPAYEDLSYKIACRLYDDEDWKRAEVIGVTVSRFPEVDTFQIIRKAWEQRKQVVIPKCYPKEKKMVFHELSEFSQLESVFYGLLEPIEALTREVGPDQIDLLIVPGLAYTKEGFRLGFGGGYYDRYLKSFPGKAISLAFNCQIVPDIQIENHDIPVAKIITNDQVIQAI